MPVALPLLLLATSVAIPPAEGAAHSAPPDPPIAVVRIAVQRQLDSLRVALGFPGATVGVTLADGRTLAFATGSSDTIARKAMAPTDRLLQGSVGKTYVAAVVLQLVDERRLALDDRVQAHLGHLPWFARVPNAATVTVRQLLQHTSGIVRYEFNPAFGAALTREPLKEWTPAERLAYLLDTPAPFAAGTSWEYSDTNYILLGMIVERLTGKRYDDELRRRLLVPLALRNTVPANTPTVAGLANGYAGTTNELGGYDASLSKGRLAVNPQFEWTGGGVASTSEDLSRWAKLLYEGKAFDSALLPTMLDAVPSKLGPGARYGLGVIVRETPIGPSWGHSGFFPGYATEMAYFPRHRVAVAVQVNATDPYPRRLAGFLVQVARVVAGDTVGGAAPSMAITIAPPSGAAGTSAAADTGLAAARAAIVRAMEESAVAWNRADLDGHVAMYTDSATMMSGQGPLAGRATIRGILERGFFKDGKPTGQLAFSALVVTPLGPTHAMLTGAFVLTSPGAAPTRGRFTTVWMRTPAGWRIIHDHSG